MNVFDVHVNKKKEGSVFGYITNGNSMRCIHMSIFIGLVISIQILSIGLCVWCVRAYNMNEQKKTKKLH